MAKEVETTEKVVTVDNIDTVAAKEKVVQDLANKSCRSMVAVIDAMCQRGAFKGEELSTIGGLRDQCIQIVQVCENIEQEAAMEADED